jgi:hypothetical protein
MAHNERRCITCRWGNCFFGLLWLIFLQRLNHRGDVIEQLRHSLGDFKRQDYFDRNSDDDP